MLMLIHLVSALLAPAPCGRGAALLSSPPLSSRPLRAAPRMCAFAVEDPNLLQTKLAAAIKAEDYAAAAELRDKLQVALGDETLQRVDWASLGLPEWLCDRLERLDFMLATRVQLHALSTLGSGADAAIVAPTGSGKTFAYLLPLMASLGDRLLADDLRRRDQEDGGAGLSSSLNSALEGIREAPYPQTGDGREDGRLGTSVPTPALMIAVPTRELGVQVSLLIYRLFGGGGSNPALQPFSRADRDRHQPGDSTNMFTYRGPRGAKVAGVWDEQGMDLANLELLRDVHVLVGTPHYLSRVAESGIVNLEHVRTLVVDEADVCLETSEMGVLIGSLRRASDNKGAPPPQVILAGASLQPPSVLQALENGLMAAVRLVSEQGVCEYDVWAGVADAAGAVGAAPYDPAAYDAAPAAGRWQAQRVPAGHSHQYLVCDQDDWLKRLTVLLRGLFEGVGEDEAPPRAIVYTTSADEAVIAASKLQGTLWSLLIDSEREGVREDGLWGLSVLLPSDEQEMAMGSGRVSENEKRTVLESSLRVMEMFRTNRTNVLVTTAGATRGLDFPQVTHVFNLGLIGTAADYVHRAGRVGRIGQNRQGSVLSLLAPAEVPKLLALGEELQFSPDEIVLPATAAISEEMGADALKQALEDVFWLGESDYNDDA